MDEESGEKRLEFICFQTESPSLPMIESPSSPKSSSSSKPEKIGTPQDKATTPPEMKNLNSILDKVKDKATTPPEMESLNLILDKVAACEKQFSLFSNHMNSDGSPSKPVAKAKTISETIYYIEDEAIFKAFHSYASITTEYINYVNQKLAAKETLESFGILSEILRKKFLSSLRLNRESISESKQVTIKMPINCLPHLNSEIVRRLKRLDIGDDSNVSPRFKITVVETKLPLINLSSGYASKEIIVNILGKFIPLIQDLSNIDNFDLSANIPKSQMQKIIFRIHEEAYFGGHVRFGLESFFYSLRNNKSHSALLHKDIALVLEAISVIFGLELYVPKLKAHRYNLLQGICYDYPNYNSYSTPPAHLLEKLNITESEDCKYVLLQSRCCFQSISGKAYYLFPREPKAGVIMKILGDGRVNSHQVVPKHGTINDCFAFLEMDFTYNQTIHYDNNSYYSLPLIDCLVVVNPTDSRRSNVSRKMWCPNSSSSSNNSTSIYSANGSSIISMGNPATSSSFVIPPSNSSSGIGNKVTAPMPFNIPQFATQATSFPKRWFINALQKQSFYPWLSAKNDSLNVSNTLSTLSDNVDELLKTLAKFYDFQNCKVIDSYKSAPNIGDIISSSTEVSLRCPLSLSRIKVPGKFSSCSHHQCFDLLVFKTCYLKDYIIENPNGQFLTCPVCSKSGSLSGLSLNLPFMVLLNQFSENVEKVTINVDGTFGNADGNQDNAEISVDVDAIEIGDDEDEDDGENDPSIIKDAGNIPETSPLLNIDDFYVEDDFDVQEEPLAKRIKNDFIDDTDVIILD